MIFACVMSSCFSSPTILRSRMTINREQVRSISSISEEMNVTLTPLLGKLEHQLLNLNLGANVDASRGFIQDEILPVW